MSDSQGRSEGSRAFAAASLAFGACLLIAPLGCGGSGQSRSEPRHPIELRMGVGEIDLNQFVQNFTVESLARVDEDGHMLPRLAKGWDLSPDKLSLFVDVRPGVTFHDGSPISGSLVAEILHKNLSSTMGSAAEDIVRVTPISDSRIELKLRRPSQLVLEALEAGIQKPDAPKIGTGAFVASPDNANELLANSDYYLGRPIIDRVVVSKYPGVRTSWAELLRNNIDMVYDVGASALDSLQSSTTISVFSYIRHYQFILTLNPKTGALHAPEVRRALNLAIDRAAFVRDALDGHGVPSFGPIWPKHWALAAPPSSAQFNPTLAASIIADYLRSHPKTGDGLTFTCLVAAGDERMSLVLKRQLEAVGVRMILQERPIQEVTKARLTGQFEAILGEVVSGPGLLRPFRWWYSKEATIGGVFSSPAVDAGFDKIRYSASDDQYRAGVADLQKAMWDDPPAVFLAWTERARAVSKKFAVPAEPGVDTLGTLRLWRLNAEDGQSVN